MCSIAVPVTIFDDGSHAAPTPHVPPCPGTLVFTPGALLRNGRGQTPADWPETTTPDGQLFTEGYYRLYRRRLLPVFSYINDRAARPRSAFVTVPGLGCGQFSGSFRGELGAQLRAVLERLLVEYGASLPNLKVVYFDPYDECENDRREIHGISFMVRPLRARGISGSRSCAGQSPTQRTVTTFPTAPCTASLRGTTSPGRATTSSSAPAPPTTVSRLPRAVPCRC